MTRKVSGRLRSFSFSVLPSVRLSPRPVRRTRTFYFYPPTTPGNFCFGIGDEACPCVLALISSLRKVPARPSRPRLGHMDPSSPIEKHFVLPPILYAGCQHILSIAGYHYAEELTQPAKKWLTKSFNTEKYTTQQAETDPTNKAISYLQESGYEQFNKTISDLNTLLNCSIGVQSSLTLRDPAIVS
jgi:hypothetical protein